MTINYEIILILKRIVGWWVPFRVFVSAIVIYDFYVELIIVDIAGYIYSWWRRVFGRRRELERKSGRRR